MAGKKFQDRERAFKIWLRTRNKAEVARQLNVHISTVFKWAKEDNWDKKCEELKVQLKSHLDFLRRCADDEAIRVLAVDFAFLDYLQEKVSKLLVEGKVEPKTWKDILATQDFIFKWRFQLLGLKDTIKNMNLKNVTNIPPRMLQIDVEEKHGEQNS